MILYGYGLAYYVIEASLGIPTTVRGSCDGTTAGMFGEAMIAELWDGVDKAIMAGTHKAQEGASGEAGTHAHTGGETSMGTLQDR
jgi:hypothetical protein